MVHAYLDKFVVMPESFDHIIRSPELLERIRQYIKDNPKVNRQDDSKANRQDACDTSKRGTDAKNRHLEV
jgi:hypothetical protein